jgi:hypothetical protein
MPARGGGGELWSTIWFLGEPVAVLVMLSYNTYINDWLLKAGNPVIPRSNLHIGWIVNPSEVRIDIFPGICLSLDFFNLKLHMQHSDEGRFRCV